MPWYKRALIPVALGVAAVLVIGLVAWATSIDSARADFETQCILDGHKPMLLPDGKRACWDGKVLVGVSR